ncbi:MAG: efflux RND transporter periplasmic adaptor subunit [Candidatus Zixiibacteriota bacterium]|nr:MAG: efflux RND transporter periplasmic adaptor subunit [candidate division Zixibacteria bacterium]
MKKIALVCLVFSLVTGSAVIAQGPPPVLVVTDTVKELEFHDQVTLVGRTEAKVASKIVSEVSGRVREINVSEGVRVMAGSPLIIIDSDRIRFSLESKRAQAEQAKLHADLTATQKVRAQELFDRDLISESGYDSAATWASITMEQYNELEAERKLLELDLKKSVISAPFTGHTGRRLVDIGEWVNPGMPVFEMVDISSTRVRVDLPERYFGRVAIGSPVTITRSANPSEVWAGKVSGIDPNASEETHTFPIIIEVPQSGGKLGGGMLVRATLELDKMFTSLAVSKDAVVRQGNQALVYTIVDGKASPVPVITTSTSGEMVAVSSEMLTGGMTVVVRGNERIFPGSPVKVIEANGTGQDKPSRTSASQASTKQ